MPILMDTLVRKHFKQRSRKNPLQEMTHDERVQHFINQGSDKWRAEQLAREYR